MYESAEELVEIFRNNYPLSLFVVASFLFLISPAHSATEFSVYRMQHFDLQGVPHGSRNALLNVEARPLSALSYSRKCVLARLKEIGSSKFKEIVGTNAAGLIIILPSHLDLFSPEDQDHLEALEMQLLAEEIQIPVYFTIETPSIMGIYSDLQIVSNVDNAPSAFEAILSSTNLNGFQLVINSPVAKALNNFEVTNIYGRLQSYGSEDQLPTFLIVAHYDSFSAVPSLSTGADSNGSGVASLLELVRLFAKLFQNSKQHARYNVEFLLTGAGKFNFMGTKRWLEDQIENGELTKVAAVVCLDSIGGDGALKAFISKPPKQGTISDSIIKREGVEMVHKKINLAEESLAWEHERFSLQRLPAFTLSTLPSHKHPSRRSLLDTRSKLNVKQLAKHTEWLAEALVAQVFNFSSINTDVFANELSVSEENLASWLDFLTNTPRAAQMIDSKSPLLSTFEHVFHRYLRFSKRHTFKPDSKEPEFTFYSGFEFTMSAYSVKPAIFDLALALVISVYLAGLYLVSLKLSSVYLVLVKLYSKKKSN